MTRVDMYMFSKCSACGKLALWRGCYEDSRWHYMLMYPDLGMSIRPNQDLPEEVLALYEEAASIASRSPRGAAALLRLAIDKLCEGLGATGSLNDKIGKLVQQGLPPRVQQALDIVRVTGNKAVHPGEINFEDEPETVNVMFKMINLIAEKMITEPQELDELFESLPEEAKQHIQKRDAKTSA